MKTALVIGATGLVGNSLTRQLLDNESYTQVTVFGRRSLGFSHPKLKEHIINFDKIEDWAPLVQGDELFSCLGTTLRQAGSKVNQYRIDYQYQYDFARVAKENAVPSLILVSSAGANPKAAFFYMRMKGELERDVKALGFSRLILIKPGPLDGPREKKRFGESLGLGVNRFLNALGLMKKYRPIHGQTVARAMINASDKLTSGTHEIELDALFDWAEK